MTALDDTLAEALRSGVRQPVLTSPEELAPYSVDFGRTVQKVPAVVVKTTSEQELVHTLQVARARGIPVSVRGAGHSCRAQSLCEGGIVIDNSGGEPHVVLDEEGLATLTTRSRWGDVETALNLGGRTVPVLTDHLATAVGGTLSVAGYGARSLLYGAQLDQVERLRLILPDGSARWCSEQENAELFQFALGGFGQVGVIEQAVMRTLPYRPAVRIQLNRFASFSQLVEAIAWTERWEEPGPDHFFGQQKNGAVWSVFGASHESVESAEATPIPGPPQQMKHERTHAVARPTYFVQARTIAEDPAARPRQYWSDYCFEFEGLRAFVEYLESLPRERLWDKNCMVRMLCLRRGRTRWPFDIRSLGTAPRLYGIGVYYRIEPGEMEKEAQARASHEDFLARCLELGGRPYLYGCNALTPELMHRLYGGAYERLQALRRELDPQGLLNRGGLP